MGKGGKILRLSNFPTYCQRLGFVRFLILPSSVPYSDEKQNNFFSRIDRRISSFLTSVRYTLDFVWKILYFLGGEQEQLHTGSLGGLRFVCKHGAVSAKGCISFLGLYLKEGNESIAEAEAKSSSEYTVEGALALLSAPGFTETQGMFLSLPCFQLCFRFYICFILWWLLMLWIYFFVIFISIPL